MHFLSFFSSIALILSCASLTTATPQIPPKNSQNNPNVPLPAINATCTTGQAWFMCCDKWKGGHDNNYRRNAARVADSVVTERQIALSQCSSGALTTLQNAQYRVRCPRPSEIVCCRSEDSSEEGNAICQVMHNYKPDKLGYNGVESSFSP